MEDIFNIVTRTFGAPKKKNMLTGQISVDCPVCDSGHHKGNLEINIAKNIYSCWSCRDSSDGVKGMDIRWLIKKYGSLDDFKYYNDLYPNLIFKSIEKSNEDRTRRIVELESAVKQLQDKEDRRKKQVKLKIKKNFCFFIYRL